VVAHAVLSTPDDGCKEHPKHVERSCSEIKYRLLTAASRWKLIYIRLVMQGTKNMQLIEYSASCRSQESVINWTGYEVHSQGTVGWFVQWKWDLSHSRSMQISSGAHPASWGSFLGGKVTSTWWPHTHLGNKVTNGCSCTSNPTYIFMTYTWDDLTFIHHMNTLSFIISRSVKCTGKWPPMPYAGLCVSTWKRFKYTYYTRKSRVSKRYKWCFKPSATRLLEVCQPNLKLPSTVKKH
jgi:hypothetical protein